VPDEKVVVMGLVTTRTSRVERPEQIESRLHEASSLISRGRLAACPLGGFATSDAGNAITPRHNSPSSPLLVRAARELLPA
jgi:5-methyltetrahydropteroyltriglutamate--homocysteine methyltransferase